MADSLPDPLDVLAGIDAPRPLPPELRSQLEEQLLGQSARPLDAGLDARLAEQMTDPVASVLTGLDAPRPLTAAQRGTLSTALVRRRRAPWLSAAAVAVLVAGGLAVLSTRGHTPSPEAGGAAAPRASQTLAPLVGGAGVGSTTGTTGAGGTTGGGLAMTPVPRATVPADAQAEGPAYDAVGRLQISPQTGPAAGGTTVRLSGADLRETTSVLFGSRRAESLVVHSDGTVSVRTPSAPRGTSVDVTAVLRDGRRLVIPRGYRYT